MTASKIVVALLAMKDAAERIEQLEQQGVSLEEFERACSRADDLVWMLDPTLARAAGDLNLKQRDAVRAARAFVAAFADFRESQRIARARDPRIAAGAECDLWDAIREEAQS